MDFRGHALRLAGVRHRQTGRGGHGRGAAGDLVRHLGVGVEVRPGVNHLHMEEAGLLQSAAIVVEEDSPGDAADVGHHVTGQRLRQRLLEGDVADGGPTARLEDAVHLSEHGPLVRRQVDDAVADDAVRAGVGQRQPVDGGEVKRDVAHSPPIRVPPRPVDHFRRHVDADGLAGRADPRRRQQYVQPGAAAEVHDRLARSQSGEGRRVAARQPQVGVGGDGG